MVAKGGVGAIGLCLALAFPLPSVAQFEWGVGGGVFIHTFSGSSGVSPFAPSVSNEGGIRPVMALTYRERSEHTGNFFAEASLLRSSFSTEIYSGGHYGSTKYLDVRLEHLYLTFGPEFGTATAGLRFGLQLGFLVNGHEEGKVAIQSPDTSLTWKTIPPSSANDFKGDLRFLVALHYNLRLKGRVGLCIDPFVSMPLTSILKGEEQKLKSQQMGVRLGVFKKVEKGGVWKALRSTAQDRITSSR